LDGPVCGNVPWGSGCEWCLGSRRASIASVRRVPDPDYWVRRLWDPDYRPPWLQADGSWRPTYYSWAVVGILWVGTALGLFFLVRGEIGRGTAALALDGVGWLIGTALMISADMWDGHHPRFRVAPPRFWMVFLLGSGAATSGIFHHRSVVFAVLGVVSGIAIIGLRNHLSPDRSAQNARARMH
jgi:hypothetical protein